ncbi:type II/IV secretion system ATPase subunit [Ignisphaera sp. 4213-co]|uniref:Type II/IV secretion system ATPase subunit n=1 Tax=Ignisphaera cupida TaxID=3050454 RepID=A0ABD4Z687_9CREN|nr:type II/IV secretion system ATPase subunit [Ignisphaera sp. 4213-co]MDK6028685.1 type II/IV secretion system ATPase subunit [Ignisphaera sp. 4213-co]
MSVKPVIRMLYPPKELKCVDSYEIEDLYIACITFDKRYVVFDKTVGIEPLTVLESKAESYLKNILVSRERDFSKVISQAEKPIRHILERQLFGYGVVEPMLMDENVIDIHIVMNNPIKVTHRRYGDMESNIMLSEEEIKELVMRMSTLAGKAVSEANPLASFIEPRYEARVSIVYLSDVTLRKSATVDIRKQPKKPWSILKIIDLGTLTVDEASFLWLAIKYKVPIMIVGEMMSGKTTLATAILNLIPPNSKIITIEDAPEIKLCTKYWTRTTTRETAENPVTVFSLLKVALRLSVDYVVVGEVRGEEARDWAQAILLGHGAVTTFHADSPESALLRLTTPPIMVNPQALKLLNVFVKTIPLRKEEKLVRRSEIYIYDAASDSGEYKLYPLFTYNPKNDAVQINPGFENPIKSFPFFKRVVLAHGITLDDLEKEYNAMRNVMRSVYEEAKKIDPLLEKPDVCELADLLYKRLGDAIGNKI